MRGVDPGGEMSACLGSQAEHRCLVEVFCIGCRGMQTDVSPLTNGLPGRCGVSASVACVDPGI